LQLLPHRHPEPFGSLRAGSAERSEESSLKKSKKWILRCDQNDKTRTVADYGQNQLVNSQL
jgi:hypothetical protein